MKLFNAFMGGVVLVTLIALGIDKAFAQDKPPQASFGVMQCNEVIAIWVITSDGKLFRTDAQHHPESVAEYNAFLEWLKTAQSDIYVLPCPGEKITGGGKQHKTEKI